MDLNRRISGRGEVEHEGTHILENTLIYKGPLERAAFVTYFGMGWTCTGGV